MENTKSFRKEFNKWKKGKWYLFEKDFYTQLLNQNNDLQLDKWTVEKLLFAIKNNKNEILQEFDITKNSKDTISGLENIFSKFGQKENFKNFWPFLFAYLEYRKNSSKDFDKEYDILKLYWIWVNDLYNNDIVDFNKWIILTNKYIYERQKGFKLK